MELWCACRIAAEITTHHPGLSLHLNCNRKWTKPNSLNTYPKTLAPSGSTGISLTAFLTSIFKMIIRARSPNLTLSLTTLCTTSCITPASAHVGIPVPVLERHVMYDSYLFMLFHYPDW